MSSERAATAAPVAALNPRLSARLAIEGPAGTLEAALDNPAPGLPAQGLALVCHPHPLHGGSMDNKVVVTVARACLALGWRVLRFNFRGIGRSAGQWDEGRGEVDDAMAALAAQRQPGEAVLVAGFSFGGYVASQVAARLQAEGAAARRVVLVGPATANFAVAPVPPGTLVVHAEADEVVPLQAVLDWARPQALPVTVVPGGSHLFHGQLPLLKSIVMQSLATSLSTP